MTSQEQNAILRFFNSNEQLDILDPDGICSFITFHSVAQAEDEEGIYLKLEVSLNPNGEDFEDVFIYYPTVKPILEEKDTLAPLFIQEFETSFIEWIRDSYYESFE